MLNRGDGPPLDSALDRADPMLRTLVEAAVARHRDVGRPARVYRGPTDAERVALADLVAVLRATPVGADAETIQFEAYEAGKRHGGQEGLRAFFALVYGVLLGEDRGSRLGTLAEAVGAGWLADRLKRRLAAGT